MKKAGVFILCLIIISISCSKTDVKVASNKLSDVTNNNISGSWILVKSSGGFAGEIYTPTNKRLLNFQASGNYTSSINDTLIDKGNYNIAKANTIYGDNQTVIIFASDNGTNITDILNLKNDTLTLASNYADGFVSDYIRQK